MQSHASKQQFESVRFNFFYGTDQKGPGRDTTLKTESNRKFSPTNSNYMIKTFLVGLRPQ